MKRWVSYCSGPLVEKIDSKKKRNCSGNVQSVKRDVTCGEHQGEE